MRNNIQIQGAVEVLAKFNRTIRFNLVRFGSKRFGFVCAQTGKVMFLEWNSRLDAAVGVVSRYYPAQADKDAAFINPKSVASVQGLCMAFDLILAAGFVKIEGRGQNRRAVVATNFDMNQNQ